MNRGWLCALLAGLAAFAAGCAFNQPYPMRPGDLVRLIAAEGTDGGHRPTAREWLREAHAELARTFPLFARPALLTEDLSDGAGRPRDVFGHFGVYPGGLRSIWTNFEGLRQTINGIGAGYAIESEAPPWEGFEAVWIPVTDGVSLYGRLGFARAADGRVRDADCIIVLPGIFGDAAVRRSRDMSRAVIDAGFHCLALEMRGHGRTEFRHPDKGFTFGVIESVDMLRVEEWLRGQPHVRRVGVIGYCWSANIAMLAAWIDGCGPQDPMMGERVRRIIPPVADRPHFEAGIIAFSPVLHFEEIIDQCDTWKSPVWDPIIFGLENVIQARMLRKGYGPPNYSLRRLIDKEFARSALGISQDKWREWLDFLRMVDYRDKSAGDKFECVRVPLLIVHGCNDPLIPAQYVAEFIAHVANPNVAAVVLPSGGHVGVATYSRRYYYSLIMNFFDPHYGPGRRDDGPSRAGPAPDERGAQARVSPARPASDG